MSMALELKNLSKRYDRTWALRDCTVTLPAGHVAALVGPNGAGKTTLLYLAAGLLKPSDGKVLVFGCDPHRYTRETLPRTGFLAQDHPLYEHFTVADLLTMGRKMNLRWNQRMAEERLALLEIPLRQRADRLSGGQQAQVALTLALAKRPDLLLLDEPLASMDPLARRNFLRVLLGETAEHGLTVLLSSHIISDLERVCDYLILLADGHVQLAGEIDEIIRSHKRLTGPRTLTVAVGRVHDVIEEHHTERQTTLLVCLNGHLFDPSWEMHDVTLEEIVLAYMGQEAQYRRMEMLHALESIQEDVRFEESGGSIGKEIQR